MLDICGVKLSYGDFVFILSKDYFKDIEIRSLFGKRVLKECPSNESILDEDYFGIVVGENEIFTAIISGGKIGGYHIINHNNVIKICEYNEKHLLYYNQLKKNYNQAMLSEIITLKPGEIFTSLFNDNKYVYLGNISITLYEKSNTLSKEYNYISIHSNSGNLCIKYEDFQHCYGNAKSYKYDFRNFYTFIIDNYILNADSAYLIPSYFSSGILNMNTTGIYVKEVLENVKLFNIFIDDTNVNNLFVDYVFKVEKKRE